MRFCAYGCRTVFERNDVVTEFIAGPHRRFDTTICQKPSEGDRIDFAASENEIQVCRCKPIKSPFPFDHDVSRLGFEGLDDLRSPGALLEDLPVPAPFQNSVGCGAKLAKIRCEM